MLRSAVIGVGAMGIHHARVYNELDAVEMVAIADVDARRAEATGRRFKVPFYTEYLQMLDREKPNLVSIAVPTSLHHDVVLEAMARGVHVLVEKPIASSIGEAEEMVQKARQQGVKLAVGHIERFNPAVIELKRRLDRGEIGRVFLIHARRLGPFPERVQDMGVVIDLAAHDLDIMLYLLGEEVERVYAETARWVHARHEDLLAGLLYFRNGALGLLDINRLTPTKIRELVITGERGMFLVNYLTQDLYFYENTYTVGNWDSLGILKGVGEGNMVKLTIARKEPLRAELEAFVRAVEHDGAPPVSGEEGMRVLALALQLLESGKEHRIIERA